MSLAITVYRYDPDVDKQPYPQTYQVDPSAVKGNMLLDALEAIKKNQDPTLSFRRSCGEGVCGSDGMNINGKNGLACVTPLAKLPKKVTLKPLPSFPIVRDLIVDMSNFYKQYESIKPYLKNDDELPVAERLQTPEERAKLDGLYECILCACCTSACPSYWWNPDKFVGPAGLLWACRFIMDSRDMSTQTRLQNLQGLFRLYRCRSIMNCVDVCPKGLNPTKAIAKIKREMLESTR